MVNDRLAADQASQDRIKKLQDIAVASYNATNPDPTADLFGNNFLGYLAKPIGGAMDVAVGKTKQLLGTSDDPNATAGEMWKASTGAYDQELREAQQKAGTAGTVAQVAGSVLSPLNWIGGEAAPFYGALASGGIQGAAEHSNTPTDALTGAATGAALSSVLPGALQVAKPVGTGVRWLGESIAAQAPKINIGEAALAAGQAALAHDWRWLLAAPAAWGATKAGGLATQGLGWGLQHIPPDNPTANAIARRAGLAAAGMSGL